MSVLLQARMPAVHLFCFKKSVHQHLQLNVQVGVPAIQLFTFVRDQLPFSITVLTNKVGEQKIRVYFGGVFRHCYRFVDVNKMIINQMTHSFTSGFNFRNYFVNIPPCSIKFSTPYLDSQTVNSVNSRAKIQHSF